MNKNSSQSIQESLKLMNQCPVCKEGYETSEDNILEEKNGAHLIHITCPHCQSKVSAMVMVSQVGLSSVGMVTDLTADDVLRLRNQEPVSENELLDFHVLLKENVKLLNY